jgi:hypothetical protein
MTLAIVLPLALAASAASAAGSSSYCLKGPGKTMNCQYQTLASCDKAKKGSETCVKNTSNTTGAGMSKSQAKKKY